MKLGDDRPSLGGRLSKIDQVKVLVGDHALVGQTLEIDQVGPVLFAVQNDRDVLHPISLTERERVEQLVECAESARKNDQRRSAQDEVKLAKCEITETENKAPE